MKIPEWNIGEEMHKLLFGTWVTCPTPKVSIMREKMVS